MNHQHLNVFSIPVCTGPIISGPSPVYSCWDCNFGLEQALTLDDPCHFLTGYTLAPDYVTNFVFEVDIGCVDWVTTVEMRNTNNVVKDR